MTDREKVIKGLECCVCGEAWMNNPGKVINILSKYKTCAFGDKDERVTVDEIIAMLKTHEPRVMTLEEVIKHDNQNGCVWFEQPTYNAVAAFVRKDEFEIEVISPYILGTPINHAYWLSSNYNVTWRCWDKKPTDEQMKAVKWDG